MKPGDEIMFEGKTYVAGDVKLLRLLLGCQNTTNWIEVCGYCKKACRMGTCIATLRRYYQPEEKPLFCSTYETYYFLKPQQPITGESK